VQRGFQLLLICGAISFPAGCVQSLSNHRASGEGVTAKVAGYDEHHAAVLSARVNSLKQQVDEAEQRYREALGTLETTKEVREELHAQVGRTFKAFLAGVGELRSYRDFPVLTEADARAAIKVSAQVFGYGLTIPADHSKYLLWKETGTFVRVDASTDVWRVSDYFFFPTLTENRPLQWTGDGWLLPTPSEGALLLGGERPMEFKRAAAKLMRAIYSDLRGVRIKVFEPERILVYHYQEKRSSPWVKDFRWVATVLVKQNGQVVGLGVARLLTVIPSQPHVTPDVLLDGAAIGAITNAGLSGWDDRGFISTDTADRRECEDRSGSLMFFDIRR
jgi:hypothetical protein